MRKCYRVSFEVWADDEDAVFDPPLDEIPFIVDKLRRTDSLATDLWVELAPAAGNGSKDRKSVLLDALARVVLNEVENLRPPSILCDEVAQDLEQRVSAYYYD